MNDTSTHGEAVPFLEARKFLPTTWRPSKETWYRWANHGVRGGVKLHTIRIGGGMFTTETAVRRFVELCGLDPAAREHRKAELHLDLK